MAQAKFLYNNVGDLLDFVYALVRVRLYHGGKSGVNFMYGTIAGPYGANAQALMCAQECQCFCCICVQHKSGGFRARVWAQRTRGALTSRNDDRRNVARGHNHLL